jgi:hypothetical protein
LPFTQIGRTLAMRKVPSILSSRPPWTGGWMGPLTYAKHDSIDSECPRARQRGRIPAALGVACPRETSPVTPQELRARARQDADELGPKPEDPRELRLWTEERRGAVVLLALLADRDAALLRRAALEVAGEWVDPVTRDLLLDATQECR